MKFNKNVAFYSATGGRKSSRNRLLDFLRYPLVFNRATRVAGFFGPVSNVVLPFSFQL
jgi:hypothetical protein